MSFSGYPSSSEQNAIRGGPLICCTNGTDGYPSLMEFNARMERYVNRKRHAERTAISQADLQRIHALLSDPDALRAEPSASYRTWIKKTFFLRPTPAGTIVCHREKDPLEARPIAPKEMMYFVLKQAHAGEGHGGRDKTAKAVKKTHSFVRKGLICLFLESCPTCQARIEAVKKEKMITTRAGSKFITESMDHLTTSGLQGYQPMAHRYSLPSAFGELDHIQPPNLLNVHNLQMPIALAQVPAAPSNSFGISSQGSSMSSCHFTAPPASSAPPQHYLITPHTASSFGDFQNQQLNYGALYPEGKSFDDIQLMSQVNNLPMTGSQPEDEIEFFDPFTLSNIPYDANFQPPAEPTENLASGLALAPLHDAKAFDDFLASSLQSPISPPALLPFNDPEHLQQLLFPQNYTSFERSITRHSCH